MSPAQSQQPTTVMLSRKKTTTRGLSPLKWVGIILAAIVVGYGIIFLFLHGKRITIPWWVWVAIGSVAIIMMVAYAHSKEYIKLPKDLFPKKFSDGQLGVFWTVVGIVAVILVYLWISSDIHRKEKREDDQSIVTTPSTPIPIQEQNLPKKKIRSVFGETLKDGDWNYLEKGKSYDYLRGQLDTIDAVPKNDPSIILAFSRKSAPSVGHKTGFTEDYRAYMFDVTDATDTLALRPWTLRVNKDGWVFLQTRIE